MSVDQRQRRREEAVANNKQTQTDAIVAPPGSFKNYKPIPGRKGWYVDEFGHLMYDPQRA